MPPARAACTPATASSKTTHRDGRHAKSLRRRQKHLRIGLAALRVLAANHRSEKVGYPRQTQDQFKIGVRRAGADGLSETGRDQILHQRQDARQQNHAATRRGAIEDFLAITEGRNLLDIETIAEQLANDFRIALAKGGREVGARKSLPCSRQTVCQA